MIPNYLFPHEVNLVRPAVTSDSYGNQEYDYGSGATRTGIRVWLQQDQRRELIVDGGEPLEQKWLCVTNHEDVQRRDRIEWSGGPAGALVFELDGQPEPTYTPLNGFHHSEMVLKIVDG